MSAAIRSVLGSRAISRTTSLHVRGSFGRGPNICGKRYGKKCYSASAKTRLSLIWGRAAGAYWQDHGNLETSVVEHTFRIVDMPFESNPAGDLLTSKIQVFLYLPSCSIAGIVVCSKFRFPEAMGGHERNKPRVLKWMEGDCSVPEKRRAHGAAL